MHTELQPLSDAFMIMALVDQHRLVLQQLSGVSLLTEHRASPPEHVLIPGNSWKLAEPVLLTHFFFFFISAEKVQLFPSNRGAVFFPSLFYCCLLMTGSSW